MARVRDSRFSEIDFSMEFSYRNCFKNKIYDRKNHVVKKNRVEKAEKIPKNRNGARPKSFENLLRRNPLHTSIPLITE